MTAVAERTVTVADLVEAVRRQQGAPKSPATASANEPIGHASVGGDLIVVLGAHPGAGATTVAVALADALATRSGTDVQLVDAAPPESSGMIAVSDCEVEAPLPGWRASRRGSIHVVRAASASAQPADLPRISESRVVLDAGWPLRTLLAEPSQWGRLLDHAELVVVCRASVPGVRHAEHALHALLGRPRLAVVGARRWPQAAEASFGPLLTAAVDEGRAALFPLDRHVEINGVDAEPLPAALVSEASRLVELIWPSPAGAPTRRRRRVRRK